MIYLHVEKLDNTVEDFDDSQPIMIEVTSVYDVFPANDNF